jgi:hypothetical protein
VSQIVDSNKQCQNLAEKSRTDFNTSHHLRLFKNNFTPDPSKALSDFTEATYTGYAAVNLNGQFAASTKVQDGEYQTQSGTYTFSYTSGATQAIYGWYIDDGTDWKCAYLFPSPITLDVGVSFTIQVNYQEWALSIVP